MGEKNNQDSLNVHQKPSCVYDKEYFEKHCGSVPYTRDEPRWRHFFEGVAEELVRSLKPCTVLDVGCAIGLLVEALWRKGVRAYGIDISEYAINQVPQDLKGFCRLLSATEPLPETFPDRYDLVTCIEVLEHLSERDGRLAIKNMVGKADCILFSSTPNDLTEPTHVNVRPVIYWLQLFAEEGFYPDLRFDARFVSPQAFLLRHKTPHLEQDALPFFSDSITKKFELQSQREEIASLTTANQKLQGQVDEAGETSRKTIETLHADIAMLTKSQQELREALHRETTEHQALTSKLDAVEGEAERLRVTMEELQRTVGEKEAELLDRGKAEEVLTRERDELWQRQRELEKNVDELQRTVGEKEAELFDRGKAEEVLTRERGELRRRQRELEKNVEQLRTSIGDKGAELIARSRTEVALTRERDELKQILSVKESEITARDRAIESLQVAQSGLFWDLLVAYRSAKDRCLPPGSKRRALYDRGLSAVKAIRQPRGLTQLGLIPFRHPLKTVRNLNRVNVEKFLYYYRNSDPAVVEAKMKRKLGVDLPGTPPVAMALQKFGLIISGCPGDAFRYRCEHQAEQLRFLGLTVDIAYFDQVDFQAALESYRCYWLHRVPHNEAVEDFIHRAHALGKPVIFDTDDLIFDEENIPYIRALQWMSEDELGLYHDGVRRYHHTLSLCRLATVTTEPLREAVKRLFPQIRCFVNPNALSDQQLALAEEASRIVRPEGDKRIVRVAYFSGTRTHNIDFQECSKALGRVLESYPSVKVMLVGHLDVGEEFAAFGERIERYPLLPWQDLPMLLRKVDINLAPLELNNPFTEAKSALKFFEAAALSVPTVASDVQAFRPFIRHGKNGYLCRSEEEWIDSLRRLVENNGLRREIGNQARNDTLAGLTTRRQAPVLRSVLNEILQANPLCSEKGLSIAFVLRAPIAQVGGGYKVIFLLAHDLARRGHDVHLYVEPIAHLEGKTEAEILEFCRTYFGESSAQVHVGHDAIQPSDVAIATNWPTAFVVDSLPNTLCKAYLIQDYEPDFYEADDPLHEEVRKTYTLPLKKICIGRYLAEVFTESDRLLTEYFDFPLDHEIFNPVGRKSSGPIRVLFFARPSLKRRGYPTGIEALEKVHRECPEVEIHLYGMGEEQRLAFPYTNLGVLDQKELAQAMRNADIHLSFSLSNISQVPFQAMACGCAVVEAKVPSVEVMVEDGTNCILAEPDPDAVADAVLRLAKDKDVMGRIAKGGLEFVRNKTWENSCAQFHEALLDLLFVG